MLNRMQIVALALLAACQIPDVTFTRASADAPGVDATPFLSCVGLPTTCGASGNDSCCNSPEVPGGSYDRSYDSASDGTFGNPSFPATISNFRLDKYEVTVGRFRAFVNAGMGTQASPPRPSAGAHANIPGSGWDTSWNANLAPNTVALAEAVKCNSTYQTWTDTPTANEDRPMNCITWYEAMAFCAWDDGYLPTEAEWNYAATGGAEQRAYPWSSPAGALTPLDTDHATYNDGMNCMPNCAVTDPVAVGTKPAGDGRWGQSDLAGNVGEWMLDSWNMSYMNSCTDCADVTVASNRVLRGGDFFNAVTLLRTGSRGPGDALLRGGNFGVRCARSAP